MPDPVEPIDEVLRLLLTGMPIVEREGHDLDDALATRGLPEDIKDLEPWAPLYEMPFVRHVLVVAHVFGATEELKTLAQSPTPNLAILRSVIAEDSSVDENRNAPAVNLALTLGAALSMSFNMRSLGTHGVPINRLLKIGSTGDDSALLKAIRLDPTTLSGNTISRRLARATAERDTTFFKSVLGAIRDGGVRSRQEMTAKERHPRLKYCLSILEDIGQLDSFSERSAYELFAVRLGVYPQEGQSKDAARSLWRLIDRWKQFVRHDSGHVMSS